MKLRASLVPILLLSMLGISQLPAAAADDPLPSPLLLVVNKGKRGSTTPSELAIVDPKTEKVLKRITTGIESHEVAVSGDGKYAVVSNTGPYSAPGHSLSVIDLKNAAEPKLAELGPLTNPHGLAWHDGKFYFTAEGAKLIARYDSEKASVDWMMGLGQDSVHMLVLTKDGQKIYTANRGSASAGVISMQSGGGFGGGNPGRPGGAPQGQGGGSGEGRGGPGNGGPGGGGPGPGGGQRAANPLFVPVVQGPEGIDLSPDGKEVWVGCRGAVCVIDTATNKVVSEIELGGGGVNRIKFTPDGQRVLATQGNGPLTVLDVVSRKPLKKIETGGGGWSLLVLPDGSKAYVAMTQNDAVAVVDLNKLELMGQIHTGEGPDGLAWVESR